MSKRDSKVLDWLGHLAGVAACAFGGWLHTELTRLDREVAVLKYKVFGVNTAETPKQPSLFEHREPLLANPLFSLPSSTKPKESSNESPRH